MNGPGADGQVLSDILHEVVVTQRVLLDQKGLQMVVRRLFEVVIFLGIEAVLEAHASVALVDAQLIAIGELISPFRHDLAVRLYHVHDQRQSVQFSELHLLNLIILPCCPLGS